MWHCACARLVKLPSLLLILPMTLEVYTRNWRIIYRRGGQGRDGGRRQL